MPTYLYFCPTHEEFEEYHSMSIVVEFCPQCKEDGNETPVKRLINCKSRGVVELTGNDLTDKVKQDVAQLKRDASKSEKVYSNLIGEDTYNNVQKKLDRQKRGW